MNDLLFYILKIVLSVCATLVATYLIPFLKRKLKEEKYNALVNVIDTAVKAAEQTINESGMGTQKKEEVIAFATSWMLDNGIMITNDQLSQIIEACVYKLNSEK